MPYIGQTASIGAVVEMGVLGTLERLLNMESRQYHAANHNNSLFTKTYRCPIDNARIFRASTSNLSQKRLLVEACHQVRWLSQAKLDTCILL
jgi:hypothetical protein